MEIMSVENSARHVIVIVPGASKDQVLNAMVGPEGSNCILGLRSKPGGKIKTYTIPLYFFHDINTGNDYNYSTLEEKEFIRIHFPYNYTLNERLPNGDKDSLVDIEDKCPDRAGPAYNKGCPDDEDHDGVTDSKDFCLDKAGPAENDGCPWGDMDDDGLNDNVDQCPEMACNGCSDGCPDTDGDGISDKTDACPYIPGWTAGQDCPDEDSKVGPDKDYDRIPDKTDQCPSEWGTIYHFGCPKTREFDFDNSPEWQSFWKDYLAVINGYNTDPELVKGKLADEDDSSKVFFCTKHISGIPDENIELYEKDGATYLLIMLKQFHNYADALRFYESFAGAWHEMSLYVTDKNSDDESTSSIDNNLMEWGDDTETPTIELTQDCDINSGDDSWTNNVRLVMIKTLIGGKIQFQVTMAVLPGQ